MLLISKTPQFHEKIIVVSISIPNFKGFLGMFIIEKDFHREVCHIKPLHHAWIMGTHESLDC